MYAAVKNEIPAFPTGAKAPRMRLLFKDLGCKAIHLQVTSRDQPRNSGSDYANSHKYKDNLKKSPGKHAAVVIKAPAEPAHPLGLGYRLDFFCSQGHGT
jgi:hypothetical protein